MPESKILTGAREALAFARGELTEDVVVHVPADFDVKALRRKLGMSQAKFAASFGFGLDAVQSWEQAAGAPKVRRASCSRSSSTTRTQCGAPWSCSGGHAIQTRCGEDTFVVVETWASLAHLKAHGAAPHMAAYAAKTKDLIADRVIHVLSPA